MNAKGRSRNGVSFVHLPHYVMDSKAYRQLKCGPRALLIELIRRHNGWNNGSIGLGVRNACKALNMSDKDTVCRYFQLLQGHGLIRVHKRGGFNMKDPSSRRASEWALTWISVGDARPTKDFLDWSKDGSDPQANYGPEEPDGKSG